MYCQMLFVVFWTLVATSSADYSSQIDVYGKPAVKFYTYKGGELHGFYQPKQQYAYPKMIYGYGQPKQQQQQQQYVYPKVVYTYDQPKLEYSYQQKGYAYQPSKQYYAQEQRKYGYEEKPSYGYEQKSYVYEHPKPTVYEQKPSYGLYGYVLPREVKIFEYEEPKYQQIPLAYIRKQTYDYKQPKQYGFEQTKPLYGYEKPKQYGYEQKQSTANEFMKYDIKAYELEQPKHEQQYYGYEHQKQVLGVGQPKYEEKNYGYEPKAHDEPSHVY